MVFIQYAAMATFRHIAIVVDSTVARVSVCVCVCSYATCNSSSYATVAPTFAAQDRVLSGSTGMAADRTDGLSCSGVYHKD